MTYEYKVVTDEMPVTTYKENGTYETNIQIEEDEDLLSEFYDEFKKLGYEDDDAAKLAKLATIFGSSCDVCSETVRRIKK